MTDKERRDLMRFLKDAAKVGRHPTPFEAGYRRAMEHAQDAVQGIFEGREYSPKHERWEWPQ